MERSRSPKLKTERDEARHEVQSLPEVVIGAPSSEDSGVVARLREGRKERWFPMSQCDVPDDSVVLTVATVHCTLYVPIMY